MRIGTVVLLVVLAASPVAVLANHHAWAPYFDTQRPFSVTGTVVRVDWVNPAAFVHIRVEDKTNGQATTWAFEGESANAWGKMGLDPSMLKPGAPVTVIGWMAKPGTNLSETVNDPELAARVRAESAASAAQFEFPDGRRIPVVSNVPQPLPR